jgi:ABC-type branched-subunit amino acid transport system substrate-binding protein
MFSTVSSNHGNLMSKFCALIAGLLFASLTTFAEEPTIKIGMVASLNGSMAFYGKGWTNSASLALEELTGTKHRYQLVIEDDSSSAAGAVSAFHKLVDVDHVDVILSASANMALALAPLAGKAQVLHLGISSDASFADGKFNFNIWPAPPIPAHSLISQFEKRGIKRFAIIGLEHAWPRAVSAELDKLAKAQGLTITMKEFFEPGERNFRSLLMKFATSKSDVGVLLSWPPELDLFARQYHEMHVKTPLTTDWGFEASAEPALFNDFWFVSFPFAKEDYRQKFNQRFGYFPYAQMELGDLMVRVVVGAYEAAGSGKSLPAHVEAAASLLKLKNDDTVIGPVSFNESGVLQTDYVVKLVKDGKFIPGE